MADVRNTGTWQRVERGMSDMANLISRGEYNLALVKGRQTMEQIVRLQAARNFVIYTDLAQTIDNLYQSGYIDTSARDSYHTIRMLGNKAVHEGDNSAQDANKALGLLKKEMDSFINGRSAAPDEAEESFTGRRERASDRTPVMIEPQNAGGRNAAGGQAFNKRSGGNGFPSENFDPYAESAYSDESGASRAMGRGASSNSGHGEENYGKPRAQMRDDRGFGVSNEMLEASGRGKGGARIQGNIRNAQNARSTKNARNAAGREHSGRREPARRPKKNTKQAVNIYDVLRILIPIICIILLVILIRNLIPGKNETAPSTTAPTTVTESVQETEPVTVPPTTEAPTEPAPVSYKIKGNNVNVRYEPNTSARIYEQLSDGTEIGTVEEVDDNWVKIIREGKEFYVGRDFITPVE